MKKILFIILMLGTISASAGGNSKSLVFKQTSSYSPKSQSYSYRGNDDRKGMGGAMMIAGLGFILHGVLLPNNSVGMVNSEPRVSSVQMPNKVFAVTVGTVLMFSGIVIMF